MNRRHLLLAGGAALAAAAAGTLAWSRATGSMADYEIYAKGLRSGASGRPDIAGIIRCATLAANGHNTQPWRFAVTDRAIRLFADETRRTPVVDPDDHHLYVSLGCAAENLAIAARAAGRPGEMEFAPADGCALSWTFTEGASTQGTPVADPLFGAIASRQSTRAEYDGRAVPAEDLAALEAIAAEPGVRLVLLTDRRRIDGLRDLILAGNDAQMTDPAFMAELEAWIRFNPRAAMRTGDGLFSAASGSPSVPSVLGDLAFSTIVTAKGERARYARQLASTPVLAVFVGEGADPIHWMKVGRACQRFTLAATARGLKHAFVNQPVEVAALRPALAALIGEPGRRPDLVLRLGYGPTLPYAPRRPLDAVMM
jgi:nitroreductase